MPYHKVDSVAECSEARRTSNSLITKQYRFENGYGYLIFCQKAPMFESHDATKEIDSNTERGM